MKPHPQMTSIDTDATYHPRNDAVAIRLDDAQLSVTTRDGRVISVPLNWFPFLQAATPEQRADVTLWGHTLFWNQLDDGLSMQVILLGRP
jgi:hypothetical protein